MVIKIYDKFVDLIGRDGNQPVGSRINKLIGSTKSLDLQKKIRNTQAFGMTRLEISYRFSKNTN